MNKKFWITLASFTGALFAAVWVRVCVVRSGYHLTELEEFHKKETLDLAQIEFDLSQAKSLGDITARARAMGFKLPGEYSLDKIRLMSLK